MSRASRPVGTPRTTRLRKVACECGNIAYQSRARLSAGALQCPCGGRLIPEDPDDAALVLSAAELDQHPAVREYYDAVRSVMHGQSSHWKRGRNVDLDGAVARKLERDRRERARSARLGALRGPGSRFAAQSDPIPF